MNKKFTELSWIILEAKYEYYWLDNPSLEDYEFDLIEREYIKLAKELNLPPTASDMVGFDFKRPSCALVQRKYVDKALAGDKHSVRSWAVKYLPKTK